MTGQACNPSRAGLTACQMSMNGWPTTERVGSAGSAPNGLGDSRFLGSSDEVVDEDAEATFRVGSELADDVDEIVDAAEVFDHDAFDAQIGAPHLFDEFGVMAPLDVDATGQRDASATPLHRNRTRCGSGRSGRTRPCGAW